LKPQGRTLQLTCESGPRAGYDGYKRERGSKVHMAVDTLGQLLAVHVTPASEQERAQVAKLARQVQQVTGHTVKVAFADQGYTGEEPAQAARDESIELQIIKLLEAKGLCTAVAMIGGRAQLWLAQPVPTPRAGLRAAAGNACQSSLCGIRDAHVHARSASTSKFLTPSSSELTRDLMEVLTDEQLDALHANPHQRIAFH
jgi:Transposase DDE domain